MNRFRSLTIALAAGAAVAAAAPSAHAALDVNQASRAMHTTPSGLAKSTGLSRSALHSFVAGSQRVGGLSEKQLLKVLARPALIKSVPVYASRGGEQDVTISAVYPENGCRRSAPYVTLRSVAKIKLWTFTLSTFWCWDKSERKVSIRKGSIEPDASIPQASSIAGWRYDGVDDGSTSDFYYRYQNSGSRGAHQSYRVGKFQFCPIRIGCSRSARAKLRLGVRWTGSAWENHGLG